MVAKQRQRKEEFFGYIEVKKIDWKSFWVLACLGWLMSLTFLFLAILGAIPFLNYFVWRWVAENGFFAQDPEEFYRTKKIEAVFKKTDRGAKDD